MHARVLVAPQRTPVSRNINVARSTSTAVSVEDSLAVRRYGAAAGMERSTERTYLANWAALVVKVEVIMKRGRTAL
jgi:hypothetical protein